MAEQAQPTEPRKKPRLALLIATGFGLGYIPKAPGTAGSLFSVLITALLTSPGLWFWLFFVRGAESYAVSWGYVTIESVSQFVGGLGLVILLPALVGVWAAGRAAEFYEAKDPQMVVIDEISGQQVALLLGAAWYFPKPSDLGPEISWLDFVNWQYFLLGFILFRVFDIWKPWPVRNAEKLPGGWGIMADDWVAGLYAAAGLWIARALGL